MAIGSSEGMSFKTITLKILVGGVLKTTTWFTAITNGIIVLVGNNYIFPN